MFWKIEQCLQYLTFLFLPFKVRNNVEIFQQQLNIARHLNPGVFVESQTHSRLSCFAGYSILFDYAL
jgi:hypothetical protein